MSGHSKWATTKRQKAIVDAKRGAAFTKIGNQIAIAARAGADPTMNPSLAMVLEKARKANMPKANIERAIARAADKNAAALIEETYEAYGPAGIGLIIEIATDNKNRTMPEVRNALSKNGGRMADPGSVMFQFSRKGVIFIEDKGEDALMTALDAGAEDANEEEDGIEIITEPTDLMKVRKNLIDAGLNVDSAELKYLPNNTVEVSEADAEKVDKLLDAVDDLDDVINVFTNAAQFEKEPSQAPFYGGLSGVLLAGVLAEFIVGFFGRVFLGYFLLYGEEFFWYDSKWKGGRVVDGTGLENRQVNASQVRILSLPPESGTVAQLVRAQDS